MASKAVAYQEQRRNDYHTDPIIRQDEQPATPKPLAMGHDDKTTNDDIVTVTENNQLVFFQGMRIAVAHTMRVDFAARSPTLSLPSGMPMMENSNCHSHYQLLPSRKTYINSYNIKGAWIKNPTKHWQAQHDKAQNRFATISPEELLH